MIGHGLDDQGSLSGWGYDFICLVSYPHGSQFLKGNAKLASVGKTSYVLNVLTNLQILYLYNFQERHVYNSVMCLCD
jgi:hypothetical protein